MNTLYESILSSTNVGKRYIELTEDYLLKLGWIKKTIKNKATTFYHPEDLAINLIKYDDDPAFYSMEYDSDYEYKCKLTTKKDFAFISNFWKELDKLPDDNVHKKLIDELLKYFGKNVVKRKI